MRILHVDSALGWRGGQNQVLLTARGMARRGHRVLVGCRRGGALSERARAAGLETVELPFAGDLWPGAGLALARALRRFHPDVVQLHDPHAVGAGALAALGTGSKLIATRRVDFPLKGALSRLKYNRCRTVVAVSQAIRGVLVESGLAPTRVCVVYEGVPDRDPLPGGLEFFRELGFPPEALVIGNVAALTDHKDHATLLRAARLVRQRVPLARFLILGEGELRASLERLSAELELGSSCVFAGFRDDLDRLMPCFSLFCLSSHMEGLGTSLLDAMCFARPVVGTAAGGIPEAVEDGVTGRIVPAREPEALAQALIELLEHAERRATLGAAGRRRFEARFTDARMVEESLRAYEAAA